MEESLPPGFRFHPTDEELITYYLTRKVSEFGFTTRAIADVDLNKCEPWDLPGKASMGEKEWYFFSMRDRKYPTGIRTNRATDAGYWKTTGKDKEIFHCGMLVGMKKTLVFYRGRAPKGEKTSWVMHEYRLQNKFAYKPTKEEWVVCRVFKKCTSGKRPPQGSPCNTTSPGELGELDVSMLNSFAVADASSNALQNGGENTGCKVDVGAYMSWMAASQAAVLPWGPAGFLGSVFAANPTVQRALPFAECQPRDIGGVASLGDGVFGSDAKLGFPGSASNDIESDKQEPQKQHPPSAQLLQVDQSAWRPY